MKKKLPSLSVVEVYTGICLQKPSGFHEVMDHLFPGIMTIGCAAMQPTARRELERQIPALKKIKKPYASRWAAIAEEVPVMFGKTIEVDGPLQVEGGQVQEAFDSFLGKR